MFINRLHIVNNSILHFEISAEIIIFTIPFIESEGFSFINEKTIFTALLYYLFITIHFSNPN